MKYNDMFLYYRSIIVGLIASIVDISTLFALGHTKLNTDYALIISSFFGILIQFFGQKYWTFKNSTNSKIRKIPYIKNKIHVVICKHKNINDISSTFFVFNVWYICGISEIIKKKDAV